MALSVLDRTHSIAPPRYNRWLVPPAALAIHLSIGQVYAFSVFKNPLTALHGAGGSEWDRKQIGFVFSIAIAILGLSAALFGAWLERVGPRRAMFYSAVCFGLGFVVSAVGVSAHNLWLIYLGYGAIGGIGLGLGYISPVSTLIKWFPDRPGLATGLAIMGFGGGAMIGGPLGTKLMAAFGGGSDAIRNTFLVMGAIYFCVMMAGVFGIRVPADGWRPDGWQPAATGSAKAAGPDVDVSTAWKTPQFACLWVVLCLNVTAGIGILEQASPMIQDFSNGSVKAAEAAGFIGLLSLFNMGGRFFWATASDYIGRKNTYFCFFALGAILYYLLPATGSVAAFTAIACILLSMYGGGFSTIPAYLRDLFGTYHVSAIHGRLLTAWSTAGILGPLIVNGILDNYAADHRPKHEAYTAILHLMSGLLVVGFVANALVRPVAEKYWRFASTPTG